MLTLNAYAKINLTLDLTSVLPDGYHAINTVMQSVSLCDTVTLSDSSDRICLTCNDKSIPCDEKNTAYKAALLFFEAIGSVPAINIHIEKRIPHAAGLGGGSADAAAVLCGLNELYSYPLTREKTAELALQTGADVPFCLLGGTKLCLNKGELTAALPQFSSHILIAKPVQSISTKEAFARFDSGLPLLHPDNDGFIFHALSRNYAKAFSCALNIFEQLTAVTDGEKIKNAMLDCGASYAAMSGSGSAYFGVFDNSDDAKKCESLLKQSVPFVCACKTVDKGIEKI